MGLLRFVFADPIAKARCIFVHKNIFNNPSEVGFGDFENLKRSEFMHWFERSENMACSFQQLMLFLLRQQFS
jgi:hypothetical protein